MHSNTSEKRTFEGVHYGNKKAQSPQHAQQTIFTST